MLTEPGSIGITGSLQIIQHCSGRKIGLIRTVEKFPIGADHTREATSHQISSELLVNVTRRREGFTERKTCSESAPLPVWSNFDSVSDPFSSLSQFTQ